MKSTIDERIAGPQLPVLLAETRTESGRVLGDLAGASALLLVFLRHFGCTFCRQAISDVADNREVLKERGALPVFVHLGSPERAKPYFEYYGLAEVERISNPDASLYRHPAFLLGRTHPLSHFLKPSVWKGWFSGALFRHGFGTLLREDGFQMPGVFVLVKGQVAASYRHRSIEDRPDYVALVDRALASEHARR